MSTPPDLTDLPVMPEATDEHTDETPTFSEHEMEAIREHPWVMVLLIRMHRQEDISRTLISWMTRLALAQEKAIQRAENWHVRCLNVGLQIAKVMVIPFEQGVVFARLLLEYDEIRKALGFFIKTMGLVVLVVAIAGAGAGLQYGDFTLTSDPKSLNSERIDQKASKLPGDPLDVAPEQ